MNTRVVLAYTFLLVLFFAAGVAAVSPGVRRGGRGMNELVLAMYSSYPGRRRTIVFSRSATPETRTSRMVMTIGPTIAQR